MYLKYTTAAQEYKVIVIVSGPGGDQVQPACQRDATATAVRRSHGGGSGVAERAGIWASHSLSIILLKMCYLVKMQNSPDVGSRQKSSRWK